MWSWRCFHCHTVIVLAVSVAADRRTVTEATAAMQLTEVIEVATAGAEAEANRLLLQLLQLLP